MQPRDRIRRGSVMAFFLGLALATGLIAWQGFADIGRSILSIGWGIVAIVAVRTVPVALDGLAWRSILGSDWPDRPGPLILIRWIRDAINTLLPVAQVGGDLAGARLLMFRGTSPQVAGAGILVDKTLEMVAQLLFVAAGAVLLAVDDRSASSVRGAVAGVLVMLLLVAAFALAQGFGLGRAIERVLTRLTGLFGRMAQTFEGLNDKVLGYYRDPRRLLAGTLLHLASWLAGAFEVWLVLWFMGSPIGPADAVILESISQVIRSAGFAVPASAGIQEAGYMAVGTLVGLPPEKGLALSLVKRLRHVVTGVPALVLWQGLEGRRWLATKRSRRTAGD